jgi:uncharacterized protein YukE
MHAQGLDFFKHMSSESAFVREQMQHSTEAQTMLLEEQKSILQRVQSIKEFQGQLVESQQEFFEQQQKLHDNTKQVCAALVAVVVVCVCWERSLLTPCACGGGSNCWR